MPMKPPNKNIACLDVGERRIGVALALLPMCMPRPYKTLNTHSAIDAICQLVHEYSISIVVVGLPRGLDGQTTAQTEYSQNFALKLSEQLQDVVVVMQDEAGTSVEARMRLDTLGKPYQRQEVDAMAACVILEDWINNEGSRTA